MPGRTTTGGERHARHEPRPRPASSFPRGITRYQWLVFFVVWAGWTLDAADFGLYSLVLQPALTRVAGGNPTPADIGRVGGLISTAGLLGLGVWRLHLRHHRRLYRPGPHAGAQHPDLQRLHRAAGFRRRRRSSSASSASSPGSAPAPRSSSASRSSPRPSPRTNRARILGIMMTGGAVGTLIGGAGLRPDRPLGLALGVLCRHRPGGAAASSSAAAWSSRSISRRCASARQALAERALAQRRRPASSCASCRCSCSTGRTSSARWSGCCSASARCWRSGPATSGCRRSSAASSPARASRATTRSPISASA